MKFVKFFFFASLLALSACGDEDDNKDNVTSSNMVELRVDFTEINIAQGDERTVNILSGNGDYVVTSATEEVVTAEVAGNIVKLKAVEGKNDAQSVVCLLYTSIVRWLTPVVSLMLIKIDICQSLTGDILALKTLKKVSTSVSSQLSISDG